MLPMDKIITKYQDILHSRGKIPKIGGKFCFGKTGKPESVKFLFDCYLTETGDVVDGASRQNTIALMYAENMAGEPHGMRDDRCSDLQFFHPEASSPYAPYHVPLDPHQEEIARRFGRQLSNFSDDFEMERPLQRSETFELQGHCQFVPSNSEVADVHIARVGFKRPCNVAWKTKDGTARAGTHYVGDQGNVMFNEGEKEKVIQIRLLRNHQDLNINFIVELRETGGTEIGPVNQLTVWISDHQNFYQAESLFVENIVEANQFSVHHVVSCIRDTVTVNTFKTALMYMSSNADSVHKEFVFAFELLKGTMRHAPIDTLMGMVCNFLQGAPEIEELEQYLQENSEASESSEDSDELD